MARVDPSVSCLASPVVSSYPSRFFLIVIGAGSGERGVAVGSGGVFFLFFVARAFYSRIAIGSAGRGGEARDDEGVPFYPARFLIFTVSELMLATGIASMTRMRRRRNDWQ